MNIKNCYAFCNLKGTSVSGIVGNGTGLFYSVDISNCYFYGTTTATNKYGIAGPSTASYKFLIDHCHYPEGLNLCYAVTPNNGVDNGHNHTLISGLRITGDKSLCDSLNANVVNMPSGSYNWRDSTDRVVFNR